VPGDTLYLLEDTDRVPGTSKQVTFAPFIIGCEQATDVLNNKLGACNPLALLTTGATSYIFETPGTVESFLINPALSTSQTYTITVAAPATGAQAAAACTSGANSDLCAAVVNDIKNVKVVPNPYVVFSGFGTSANVTKPLMFTHVPPRGSIRIYTMSGQIVQQLSWTEADLNGTSDLQYNLRTRENLDLAGGLYLYMITGKDANGRNLGSHMGKFVVIR
jgi:hypothetical protein